MNDLIEFLRARLMDDERAATRAARFKYDRPTDAPWARARLVVEQGAGLSSDEHVARHDPARVLAEIEAKRRIMDIHTGLHSCGASDYDDDDPCPTLRALVLPYTEHEDYDEAWRPDPQVTP